METNFPNEYTVFCSQGTWNKRFEKSYYHAFAELFIFYFYGIKVSVLIDDQNYPIDKVSIQIWNIDVSLFFGGKQKRVYQLQIICYRECGHCDIAG